MARPLFSILSRSLPGGLAHGVVEGADGEHDAVVVVVGKGFEEIENVVLGHGGGLGQKMKKYRHLILSIMFGHL